MERPYDHGPSTDHRHAEQQRGMLAHWQRIEPGVSEAERKKQSRCSDRTNPPIPHDSQTSLSGSPARKAVHHIGKTVLVETTRDADKQEHQ
jgi:hypothetical protein